MLYLAIVAVAQVALVAWLALDRRAERREHVAQLAELLQRIQAPERAVQAHELQTAPEPSPQPLGIHDDDAWLASREAQVAMLAAQDGER